MSLFAVFDEDFVFEEKPKFIEKRTIEILLYDFDAYSRHVCIGGAQIPLVNLDLTKKENFWTPLGPCAEQVGSAIFILQATFLLLLILLIAGHASRFGRCHGFVGVLVLGRTFNGGGYQSQKLKNCR